jgi:hypothetical protein
MFSQKVLGRILMTTLTWAVVWALAGAAMGVVATLIEPDTGHIPRHLVPVMIAVPSAAFGAVAGLIFASVMASVNITVSLGPKGRTLFVSRDRRTEAPKRNRSQTGHVRLGVPAQPVDATPSNALIRQCFPGRSDLFGCTRSEPSQSSVPADLILASDLAFVFNANRVLPECCVDPLRPPD